MDNKVGARLTDILMRSHDRRHQYLYTGGVVDDDRVLVIGSHKENDFKFGDPEQSLALMRFSDDALWAEVSEFLTFFKIAPHAQPMMIVALKPLFSILSKVKWDMDRLEVKVNECGSQTVKVVDDPKIPPALYAVPVSSYFTYVRLRAAMPVIQSGFKADGCHHDIPLEITIFDKARAIRKILSQAMLEQSPLKDVAARPRSVILMKGRDMPTPKHLVVVKKEEIPHQYALRLWNPAGQELCYGGYFQMPGFELLSGRLNVFLT